MNVSLINFNLGEGLVIAFVEELQIMAQILHSVVEYGFRLVEGNDIDKVLIVKIHFVDA